MAATSTVSFVLLILCIVGSEARSFVRLCYFPSWAYGRPSHFTRFDVQHVDPTLCTHLVYAFAAVDVDSRRLVPLDPGQDDPGPGTVGRYRRFNDLKKKYPHLRTLVSVGGQYAGNEQFAHIAHNDHYLHTFVTTTVDFLRTRNFDGLDIDWEYPNATTRADYTRFLKALRTAFAADKRGKERLLLTVALPAGRQFIDPGFDIGALNRYVDLASVMTYDYHGSWDKVTGFDSPLFSRKSDPSFNNELSTDWTIRYYMSRGLAADKILVGVTAAGTRFKLRNATVTGVGAPVIKAPAPRISDLWQLQDRYAYPEICRVLQSPLAHRVFDEEQQVPYAYKGDDWFGYEDVQSLKGKVDWMMKKGVAGAMFWALDMDDFTGQVCDSGTTYPLLRALSQSVGQIEGSHLTADVNPNIRYLTKYTGGESSAGCAPASLLSCVTVAVLVVVVMMMVM
ncbi:chitinase-3-like protein 1 [Babylonia areolata]|uniref:chitinase-3-like protein 1 n=1 Tax=Babylonia areolata TaxID=304850 RepID=UPI003FD53E49